MRSRWQPYLAAGLAIELFSVAVTFSSGPALLRTAAGWSVLLGFLSCTGLLVVMVLLHRSHRRALVAVEQASSSKSEFLAVMSHEIRTPLHGLMGMTDVLLQEDLSPLARERAEVIHRSGNALLGLVSDVLDYSRLERGAMSLEHEPFDPAREAVTAAALFRDGAAKKGVSVVVESPPADAPWRRGDALRFRQIVMNLVGNATKFTLAGKVTVRVENVGPTLRLQVEDTGIGMDDVALARLFRPFEQAERSTSRRFGGSGLGLAIVKRLVDAMGGDVSVRSAKGHGTTFEVTLPLEAVPPPAGAQQETAGPSAGSGTGTVLGLKVLVADDNAVNRQIAAAMLTSLGCRIDTVMDGAAAVRSASSGAYDVVLMDWHMPEVDGLEATRRIRALGVPIPIVAVSANATPEDRRACREAGMDGFVSKPFGRAALLSELRRVAERTPA